MTTSTTPCPLRRRLALGALLGVALPALAEVSLGVDLPGLSIGINMPAYPQLVRVPGQPVYYAPQADANYFFYDGLYWVYAQDGWYSSSWYDGPWDLVTPEFVPVFVLRVPVRYYRQPPVFFRGWVGEAAPRWGEHWGHDWEQRRAGWNHWDRASAPAPAPLPAYQRNYSGNRYPHAAQQQALRSQNYSYQPHERVGRTQQPQPQPGQLPHRQPIAPAAQARHEAPPRPGNQGVAVAPGKPRPEQAAAPREPQHQPQREQKRDPQREPQRETERGRDH